MKDLRVLLSRMAQTSIFVCVAAGCGGGSATTPAPVTPTPVSSSATLQGQWQIVAHSNVNPASSILVETNFTQNGSTVTADKSSTVLIQGVPGAFTGLGGECDNGTPGDDSVGSTISGQTILYTLTEAGSLGTATSTGSATISGTQLTGGTYQTPAACGFAADSGTFTGTNVAPFSGTFAGQLLNSTGTTDAVSVSLSQSGYTLNAIGTEAGAPITLTGKVIGATFDVTGMVQGQSREYVGIYDTTASAFLVYDNKFQPLGSLTPQTSAPSPIPISVSVSPMTASVAPSGTQTFTATVSNDPAAKGVSWSLSCATANGCGSVSGVSSSSSSGGGVIYTAPATAPNPATVTITATSVTDGTKSASAAITIGPATPPAGISVTLSQTTATVAVNATTTFIAAVTGDPSNKGVTWALSGSECGGPSCGSLSAASSASGMPITYTGPAAVPSPPTVTLTVTSVADTAKSASATITVTATSPVNLGAGSFPSAAVDSNGVIDIAWFTETGVAFARSQNQGATFNTPAVAVPAPAFEPTIAVDGQGDIFILTGNNPTNSLGGNNVIVAHSTDGKTFTSVTAQQNTYESRLLVQPSGAVDLAYTNSDDNGEDPDNALQESRSTDGGNTFANAQTLWGSDTATDIQQWQAALGPQGQIYYTWTEQIDIDCEVHFVNSLDGVTFQPSVLLTNNDVCNIDGALVVDSAGNIDATWGADGTNFVRSTDQGQTFTTPTVVPISGTPGQLAVGPNGALDSIADQPFAFTQSLDNGVTWSAPVSVGLPSTPANFMGPQDAQIVLDPNGKITVVWRDDSKGAAAGDFDVYISTSTDGKNFTPATNISNATGAFASAPSILISPQGMRYVYWYETSNSNAADVNVFFYAGQ